MEITAGTTGEISYSSVRCPYARSISTFKTSAFKNSLYLLSKSGKPLPAPVLQTVFIDPSRLTIQEWFFSDSSRILRRQPCTSIKESHVINSFIYNSLTLQEKQAILEKIRLLEPHELISSISPDIKNRAVCYLLKSQGTRKILREFQLEQLLVPSVALIAVDFIGFQQHIRRGDNHCFKIQLTRKSAKIYESEITVRAIENDGIALRLAKVDGISDKIKEKAKGFLQIFSEMGKIIDVMELVFVLGLEDELNLLDIKAKLDDDIRELDCGYGICLVDKKKEPQVITQNRNLWKEKGIYQSIPTLGSNYRQSVYYMQKCNSGAKVSLIKSKNGYISLEKVGTLRADKCKTRAGTSSVGKRQVKTRQRSSTADLGNDSSSIEQRKKSEKRLVIYIPSTQQQQQEKNSIKQRTTKKNQSQTQTPEYPYRTTNNFVQMVKTHHLLETAGENRSYRSVPRLIPNQNKTKRNISPLRSVSRTERTTYKSMRNTSVKKELQRLHIEIKQRLRKQVGPKTAAMFDNMFY